MLHMWRGGIGYGVVVLMSLQLNSKCEGIWEQTRVDFQTFSYMGLQIADFRNSLAYCPMGKQALVSPVARSQPE